MKFLNILCLAVLLYWRICWYSVYFYIVDIVHTGSRLERGRVLAPSIKAYYHCHHCDDNRSIINVTAEDLLRWNLLWKIGSAPGMIIFPLIGVYCIIFRCCKGNWYCWSHAWFDFLRRRICIIHVCCMIPNDVILWTKLFTTHNTDNNIATLLLLNENNYE